MRYQKIRDLFKKYLATNHDRINGILQRIRGGWENWLQVELAILLLSEIRDDSEAHREWPYPKGGKLADIFIQPMRGQEIWIELKTQRSQADETLPERTRLDIDKILNQGSTFTQGKIVIVFGITTVSTKRERDEIVANAQTARYRVAQWTGTKWIHVTDAVELNHLTILEWNPQ